MLFACWHLGHHDQDACSRGLRELQRCKGQPPDPREAPGSPQAAGPEGASGYARAACDMCAGKRPSRVRLLHAYGHCELAMPWPPRAQCVARHPARCCRHPGSPPAPGSRKPPNWRAPWCACPPEWALQVPDWDRGLYDLEQHVSDREHPRTACKLSCITKTVDFLMLMPALSQLVTRTD